MVLTWSLIRSEPPNRASERATDTTTAKVMVRFRRRPTPISDKTNWARMASTQAFPWTGAGVSRSVLVAVDAARLVADETAPLQLDDALAHLVHDVLVVCRHQHGRARPVDAVEQLHDADGGLRVEVSGRLVGDEQLGPVHERPRDRDALLFTTGQLTGHPLLLAAEADEVEHLGHGLADLTARLADDLLREGDVLGDRLVRQQPEV